MKIFSTKLFQEINTVYTIEELKNKAKNKEHVIDNKKFKKIKQFNVC